MKRWQFNIVVVFVIMAIFALVIWLVPETRMAVAAVGKILGVVLKALFIVFMVLLGIFFPGVIGYFVRAGIVTLNDNVVESREDVNPLIHWFICVFLGFALSVGWMFVIRYSIKFISLLEPLCKVDGCNRLFESLPWGWSFVAFIVFVLGYLFRRFIEEYN